MAKDYKSVLAFSLTEAVGTGLATAILARHGFELGIVVGGIKGLMSLAPDAFQKLATKRLIENIASKACEQLVPVFEGDRIVVDDESRTAVAELLADTVNNEKVTAEVLVAHKLNPEKLMQAILQSASERLKPFNENEVELYKRALRETCRCVISVAATLPDFTEATFTSILNSQDAIMKEVLRVLATLDRDRQEAAERQLTTAERFEAQYRSSLNQLDRIELFGLRAAPQSRRYNLSVAYVMLTVEPRRKKKKFKSRDSDLMAMSLKGFSVVDLVASRDVKDNQSRRSVRSRMTVNELLSATDRIFVRGLAGSGKTTLLQWIAVRAARSDFPDRLSRLNGCVPFFIRLRHRVQQQHPRPRLVLPAADDFLGELQPFVTAPMPSGWVDQQLESGNAIMLIDGVDEVDEADQEPLRGWIKTLSSRYPKCHFVVTGRTHLKEDWLDDAGFRSAEIQSMLRADIEAFIDHWHTAVEMEVTDEDERRELPALADNLKAVLRRNSELRRLATSPLLCSMLCALHRDGQKQLPTDRVKLYSECVDVLLEKREKQADIKISSLPELKLKQKSAILQHIAYRLLLLGVAETSRANVREWVAEKLDSIAELPSGSDADSVLEALLQRSGIIREPSIGSIDFIHKTFQEFLAAYAVLDKADWALVLRNAVDERWTEVIVLAVGIAPKPTRDLLMEKFASKAETASTIELSKVYAILSAACLSLAVDVNPNLRNKILGLLNNAVPPTSRTEAKMLARIGQPAVELLSRAPMRDELGTIMCIATLANIGSGEALAALGRFANTSNLRLRAEIMRAWDYFDREEYADKVLSIALGKNGRYPVPFISPLDGLGAAKNVTHLYLTRPDVRTKSIDPTGIGEATDLQSLIIDCPQKAFDLGILAPLTNLQELTIVGVGQFLNFEALAEHENLRALKLGRCKGVKTLESLAGLNELTHLSLDSSFDCTSIAPLGSLQKLQTLEIRNFKELRDLSPLASLNNLENLSLMGCRVVTDVSAVARLARLKEVNLKACSRFLKLKPLQARKDLQVVADEPDFYDLGR